MSADELNEIQQNLRDDEFVLLRFNRSHFWQITKSKIYAFERLKVRLGDGRWGWSAEYILKTQNIIDTAVLSGLVSFRNTNVSILYLKVFKFGMLGALERKYFDSSIWPTTSQEPQFVFDPEELFNHPQSPLIKILGRAGSGDPIMNRYRHQAIGTILSLFGLGLSGVIYGAAVSPDSQVIDRDSTRMVAESLMAIALSGSVIFPMNIWSHSSRVRRDRDLYRVTQTKRSPLHGQTVLELARSRLPRD